MKAFTKLKCTILSIWDTMWSTLKSGLHRAKDYFNEFKKGSNTKKAFDVGLTALIIVLLPAFAITAIAMVPLLPPDGDMVVTIALTLCIFAIVSTIAFFCTEALIPLVLLSASHFNQVVIDGRDRRIAQAEPI